MNKPITKKEWMEYLEKTWDAAQEEALAQPEQEPDDLTIAYMAGFSRGKDLAPQRTWVGLTLSDLPDSRFGDPAFYAGAQWAEAKLKEKNT